MKLSIVITLAALALAGSAVAQSQMYGASTSDHGTSGGATSFDDSAPYVRPMTSGRTLAEQQASWRRARMSCAADMQTLCGGKNHGMSCIAYHVLSISRTCRADLEKAEQGRL